MGVGCIYPKYTKIEAFEMSGKDKEHALREHLALISVEAYLMLRSATEAERIKRYNRVQEQISAILKDIDEHEPAQVSCPDIMLQ